MNNNGNNDDGDNSVEVVNRVPDDNGGEEPPAPEAAVAEAAAPALEAAIAPAVDEETQVSREDMRQPWTIQRLVSHRVLIANPGSPGALGWCPWHRAYTYYGAMCLDCFEDNEREQPYAQPVFTLDGVTYDVNPVFLSVIGREPGRHENALGQSSLGEMVQNPPPEDLRVWFTQIAPEEYGRTLIRTNNHNVIISAIVYGPLDRLPPDGNEELYRLVHRSVLAERETMATMVTQITAVERQPDDEPACSPGSSKKRKRT